jgi:tetrahydromethanopterin S-methyltransferase subunit G
MTDADRISQAVMVLQEGQKALQATVEQQGKALNGRMDTIELKVEAFHAEQKQANEQTTRIFHNIGEINQKEIEKRVDLIEKHLNLPPLK